MQIWNRRVYDEPGAQDGTRILVDRVWPRGVSKLQAQLQGWYREVAPSTALRQWFGHDPARWDGFRQRYFAELDANPDGVAALRERRAAEAADAALHMAGLGAVHEVAA